MITTTGVIYPLLEAPPGDQTVKLTPRTGAVTPLKLHLYPYLPPPPPTPEPLLGALLSTTGADWWNVRGYGSQQKLDELAGVEINPLILYLIQCGERL